MLAAWIEILPLFIVRQLARGRCELFSAHGLLWLEARPGVLIQDPPYKKPTAPKEESQ